MGVCCLLLGQTSAPLLNPSMGEPSWSRTGDRRFLGHSVGLLSPGSSPRTVSALTKCLLHPPFFFSFSRICHRSMLLKR